MGLPVSSFPLATNLEKDDFVPIITAAGSPTGTKRVLLPNLLRVGGKVIMVDSISGIDAQGERGSALAYLTLEAAQDVAQSGDVIIVLPGTYRAGGLGKNGVNWHFYPGVDLYRTQGDGADIPAIFDDGPNGANGAVTYTISGYASFHCDDVNLTQQGTSLGDEENSVNPGLLFSSYNSSSEITIQCKGFYSSTITTAGAAVFMIYIRNANRVVIMADEVDTTASEQVGAVLWIDGELHTTFNRVRCHHTTGNGGTYAFWASEPAAGAGGADWYCRVGLIDTHYSAVYFDGVNSTYRMWLEYQEMRTINSTDGSGINLAAIECLNGGKLYVTCQKTLTKGPASGLSQWLGPIVWQTGGELWFTAQKCSAESTAAQTGSGANSPIYIRQTGGVSHYNVQHWEHVGNFSVPAGVIMSGGTMEIQGGEMTVLNGPGVIHNGGTSRLRNMRIVTSNTNNAANDPVYLGANGMTLDNCVLISPALGHAIDAGSAKNVLTTIVFSNRILNAATVTVIGQGIFLDDPAWV